MRRQIPAGKAARREGIADLGSDLAAELDRKSTRLNSSHVKISYAEYAQRLAALIKTED